MRLAAAALLALTACAPTGETPDTDLNLPEEDTPCGAHALRYLEGEPRESFDFDELDGPVRTLYPGSISTSDYLPQRLNVHINNAGIITKLACG
ncbi:I78 family peptidase inhibitor [Roseovarius sp. EL26]|uniref:I78 family peptidase inhibitor n=1 Tax=Roseovarius sp. EL26 TaxID=2126672 RepID=UPI000EA04BE2|nr:I78 family peptidase inhibitor [Roseovarius sp. EL26]